MFYGHILSTAWKKGIVLYKGAYSFGIFRRNALFFPHHLLTRANRFLIFDIVNVFYSVNLAVMKGVQAQWTLQASYYGGNYGLALALVTGVFLIATIIITALGKEAKDAQFGMGSLEPSSTPAPEESSYEATYRR